MVQLRKANVKDFQVYKKLYEDREFWYQWLYYYPIIKADESKESDLEEWGLEDIIEEYQNYTEEKFSRDLKTSRIFMIEKSGKILGSIRTFYCGNGTYKISDWGMFENDPLAKQDVIQELKTKLPRLKKLSVCTSHEPARNFLICTTNFVDTGRLFLELEV